MYTVLESGRKASAKITVAFLAQCSVVFEPIGASKKLLQHSHSTFIETYSDESIFLSTVVSVEGAVLKPKQLYTEGEMTAVNCSVEEFVFNFLLIVAAFVASSSVCRTPEFYRRR